MVVLEVIFHYSLVCWLLMAAIQLREGLRQCFTSKVRISFGEYMQIALMVLAAPALIPVLISEVFKE